MFPAANELSSAGTTRRTLLKAAAMGALGVPVLAACSSGSRVGAVRFYQSKPEVIGYFDNLVAEFNKQNPDLTVVHDSSSSLVASFVRESPHDLVLNNYDLSAGTFVTRDVLTDLGSTPEIAQINPSVQALVGQYATPEQSTHVIPYSIAAAGVIYNKQLFAQHGVAVPDHLDRAAGRVQGLPVGRHHPDLHDLQGHRGPSSRGCSTMSSGSMIDVAGFFSQLKAAGRRTPAHRRRCPSRSPSGPPSTRCSSCCPSRTRTPPLAATPTATPPSPHGKGAMYLQGPWAIGELAKVAPKLQVGTFALPVTDNPDDRKARVNLDLALWIPKQAGEPDRARTVPQLPDAPGHEQVQPGEPRLQPGEDAPPVTDERIAGLAALCAAVEVLPGRRHIRARRHPARQLPAGLGHHQGRRRFLHRLDNDWARLAERTSVVDRQTRRSASMTTTAATSGTASRRARHQHAEVTYPRKRVEGVPTWSCCSRWSSCSPCSSRCRRSSACSTASRTTRATGTGTSSG